MGSIKLNRKYYLWEHTNVSYGVGCIDFRAGNNDVKSDVWDHCMGIAQFTHHQFAGAVC